MSVRLQLLLTLCLCFRCTKCLPARAQQHDDLLLSALQRLNAPSYSKLEGFFCLPPLVMLFCLCLTVRYPLRPSSLLPPADVLPYLFAIHPASNDDNTFTHRKTVFKMATSSQRFNRSSARSERTLFAQLDRSGCCGPRLGTRC